MDGRRGGTAVAVPPRVGGVSRWLTPRRSHEGERQQAAVVTVRRGDRDQQLEAGVELGGTDALTGAGRGQRGAVTEATGGAGGDGRASGHGLGVAARRGTGR